MFFKKNLKNIPNGGISGAPLYKKSNKILTKVNKLSGGNLQIVGLGGVESGETAYQKNETGSFSYSAIFRISF